MDPLNTLYKSKTSLKIQESLPNPEKYFGNQKKKLSRDTCASDLPFQNGGLMGEKSLGLFRI